MNNHTITIFDGAVSIELPEGFCLPNSKTDSQEGLKVGRPIVTHTEDPDTAITGGISKREWNEDDLEDQLNEYANIFSRTLASVDNIQLASRDSPHATGTIGVLQLTYTSAYKDWFANLFAFPVRGFTSMLFMRCTWDNAFVRSGQFMDIAESIRLVDDEPKGKGSYKEE